MSEQPARLAPDTLLTELDDPNLLLIQVTSPEVYQQAHIPGSILVPPGALVCGIPPATGKLPSLDQLNNLFRAIGFTPERAVVVYDDEGGGWAGRLAWTLDVIGYHRWRYLDGGLHAWHNAGLTFDSGPAKPITPSSYECNINRRPIAELEDVLQAIEDPDQVIWDVRSHEEYIGVRQAAARSGHIPGAINWDWLALKTPNNDQRLIDDLAEQLKQRGIDRGGPIITHCQTHHRSGLSYMVGRLLGLDIRAYHGSWSEWGNRDDTPIELSASEQP